MRWMDRIPMLCETEGPMGQIVVFPVADGCHHQLATLAKQFLEDLAAQGRSPSTISSYTSDLRQLQHFLTTQLGSETIPIEAITANRLRAFMKTQSKLSRACSRREELSIYSWAGLPLLG